MIAHVVLKRLIGAAPVIFALVFVVFVLQKLSPLDPASALVGRGASPEVYASARQALGLDRSLPEQFWQYLIHAARGDLGQSTVTRRPVADDLIDFLPVTLELIVAATILMAVLGVIFGVATALRWSGSGVLRFVMISASSVPVFFTCLLGMIVFYRWLDVLPISGLTSYDDAPAGPTHFPLADSLLAGRVDVFADALRHLALPAFCVALIPAVQVGRVLRGSLEGVRRADYTRTAKVKGLTDRQVLLRHMLRNSLGPVLALSGLNIAGMAASSIIVETIFARPGLGQYMAQAIDGGDFNTIAGCTLVVGLLYVLSNLLVDVLQTAADPRVAL